LATLALRCLHYYCASAVRLGRRLVLLPLRLPSPAIAPLVRSRTGFATHHLTPSLPSPFCTGAAPIHLPLPCGYGCHACRLLRVRVCAVPFHSSRLSCLPLFIAGAHVAPPLASAGRQVYTVLDCRLYDLAWLSDKTLWTVRFDELYVAASAGAISAATLNGL